MVVLIYIRLLWFDAAVSESHIWDKFRIMLALLHGGVLNDHNSLSTTHRFKWQAHHSLTNGLKSKLPLYSGSNLQANPILTFY